jgi:hypothetical protein
VGLGSDYLEVALQLRRLVPEWVESYVGPEELAASVERSHIMTASELREQVDKVTQKVMTEQPVADRCAWLLAQLRALYRVAVARW